MARINVAVSPIIVVMLSAFLMACQPAVRTNIETFRDESLGFQTGSIRVVSEGESDNPSLEFRFYKDKLEAKLAKAGYQPTDDKSADFVAKLGYRVSRQEKDQPSSRVIIGGHYPGFYPRTSVLITDSVGSDFEYIRELSLTIDQTLADKVSRVIQVKASSLGRCEHFSVVYDEMLEAIFSQLARPNGSIVNVSVAGDIKCP